MFKAPIWLPFCPSINYKHLFVFEYGSDEWATQQLQLPYNDLQSVPGYFPMHSDSSDINRFIQLGLRNAPVDLDSGRNF